MAEQSGKTGKQGKGKSRGKAKDLSVSGSQDGAKGGAFGLAATALKTSTPTPILTTSPVNVDPISKITLNPQPLPPR